MSLKASQIKVGDTYSERVVEDLKRTQLVMYSGASGDYNPLHSDDLYTREVAKYPGVFAHGMLTMGMTGRMLTNYVGDGRLAKFGVRFTNQVWPGDTLTCRGKVTGKTEKNGEKIVEGELEVVNQKGEATVKGTFAVATA